MGKKVEMMVCEGKEGQAGTSGSLEQFADTEKWNDSWQVTTADGKELDLVINADITVPDTDRMAVVDVQELAMDAEYKEQMLHQFFGSEEVYYHDAAHQTAEELENLIREQEALLEKMEETDEAESIAHEREVLEQYREALETADSNAAEIAADFENCWEYRGMRNGISYIVSFSQTDRRKLTIEADRQTMESAIMVRGN